MIRANQTIVTRDRFAMPVGPGKVRSARKWQRGEFRSSGEQPVTPGRSVFWCSALGEVHFRRVPWIQRRNSVQAALAVSPGSRANNFTTAHGANCLEVAAVCVMNGKRIQPA